MAEQSSDGRMSNIKAKHEEKNNNIAKAVDGLLNGNRSDNEGGQRCGIKTLS
jgi:hypothetical protein